MRRYALRVRSLFAGAGNTVAADGKRMLLRIDAYIGVLQKCEAQTQSAVDPIHVEEQRKKIGCAQRAVCGSRYPEKTIMITISVGDRASKSRFDPDRVVSAKALNLCRGCNRLRWDNRRFPCPGETGS